MLINAAPARIASLAAEIAEIRGVREAHSTAGSEVALVALLAAETHDQIAGIVTEGICTLDGVLTTQTLISFRRFSAEQTDQAFDIFSE